MKAAEHMRFLPFWEELRCVRNEGFLAGISHISVPGLTIPGPCHHRCSPLRENHLLRKALPQIHRSSFILGTKCLLRAYSGASVEDFGLSSLGFIDLLGQVDHALHGPKVELVSQNLLFACCCWAQSHRHHLFTKTVSAQTYNSSGSGLYQSKKALAVCPRHKCLGEKPTTPLSGQRPLPPLFSVSRQAGRSAFGVAAVLCLHQWKSY